MPPIPESVTEFLKCKRIAVAGVSRSGMQPANAIFKRLRETGHEVIPVNPNATEVEGTRCFPDLRSIPGPVDAVMVVTHPEASAQVVRQAAERGIRHVWLHRSIGSGSVSKVAIRECESLGLKPIVGGCPMMYCGNVDFGHKCFRWWYGMRGRLPR